MDSFTADATIENNIPTDIGPARLGAGFIEVGPPVRATIFVMPNDGESQDYEVALGGTFPVGEETWRFADVDMFSAHAWEITVRRVDENEVMTPPTGHLWQRARLRPYGQLTEAQLQSLEAALGHSLPVGYRRWLGRTNGAQPEVDHHIPGVPFALTPERPLFGMHPGHPYFDLVQAQRLYRDPWLSRAWLVIANPSGGLLVVSGDDPGNTNVYFLHEQDKVGPAGPEGARARERRLRAMAWTMEEFIGRLTPIDLDGLPPARIVRPGSADDPRNPESPQ